MPLTDGPGRPSKLTPDGVYELLRREDEPMSASQIGAHFDATANTARKRLDEVREYQFVQSKRVGGVEVFWYDQSPNVVEKELSPSDIADVEDDFHNYARIEVTHARAEWLDRRQFAASRRDELNHLDRSVALRAQLITALDDYTAAVEFAAPAAYTNATHGDTLNRDIITIDSARYEIGEAEFCYYVSDVELWGGAVDGLADLGDEVVRIALKCESADGVGDKDDALPSFEELLHAGDLFDEFATTMFGVDW